MRPLHPCAVPNCSALISGKARCPTHTTTREERNPHTEDSRRFYDSPQWRALRAIKRKQQPICMECRRLPSKSVDHINGNRSDNRLENLQALCKNCHDRKSGREHRVKATGAGST